MGYWSRIRFLFFDRGMFNLSLVRRDAQMDCVIVIGLVLLIVKLMVVSIL